MCEIKNKENKFIFGCFVFVFLENVSIRNEKKEYDFFFFGGFVFDDCKSWPIQNNISLLRIYLHTIPRDKVTKVLSFFAKETLASFSKKRIRNHQFKYLL